MSDWEKTGGPAFPATVGPHGSEVQIAAEQWGFPGMTLRDHFAGLALMGMLSAFHDLKDVEQMSDTLACPRRVARARIAYLHADEMLKARRA